MEKAALGTLLVMLLLGALFVVGTASFLWKLLKTLLIFIAVFFSLAFDKVVREFLSLLFLLLIIGLLDSINLTNGF